MFEWLNHNAAAVQAVASIFSVVATVVLLWITRQYVGLTQELARAAREQLKFKERSAATEAAQLVTLVDVFLGFLKRFPTEPSGGEQIRTVALWKHQDITTFGSLAAAVLGTRTETQRAIQGLSWIRNNAEQVQQSNKDEAYPWKDFPWEDWTRQISEARTALQSVRADAQASATA